MPGTTAICPALVRADTVRSVAAPWMSSASGIGLSGGRRGRPLIGPSVDEDLVRRDPAVPPGRDRDQGSLTVDEAEPVDLLPAQR